jgi:hypothetical protein
MKLPWAAVIWLLLGLTSGIPPAGAEPKGGQGKGRLAPDLQVLQGEVGVDRPVRVILNLEQGHTSRVAR